MFLGVWQSVKMELKVRTFIFKRRFVNDEADMLCYTYKDNYLMIHNSSFVLSSVFLDQNVDHF